VLTPHPACGAVALAKARPLPRLRRRSLGGGARRGRKTRRRIEQSSGRVGSMLEVNDCIERQRRSVTEPRLARGTSAYPGSAIPFRREPEGVPPNGTVNEGATPFGHSGLVMIWNRQPRVAPDGATLGSVAQRRWRCMCLGVSLCGSPSVSAARHSAASARRRLAPFFLVY
jgi:hypothetical protein